MKTVELYNSENILFQVGTGKEYGLMLYFVVKTNGFSGCGPIYFETQAVNTAINTLSEMVKNLKGNLTLHDIESTDYFIKFIFEKNELFIEGNIGDYNSNSLHFGFKADQTVLTSLSDVLKNINLTNNF